MSLNVREQVMGGMLWSLLERFGSQGITFVVGVVLARLILPEQYGVIALTTVFITITSVLVDAGFGTALIQKKEASLIDYNTVFWTSSGIGLFLYVVLYIVAPYASIFFHSPELNAVLRIVSLSLLWSGYQSVLNAYLLKRMMFRSFFYRTFFASIISGIIGIVSAVHGFGVWALVAQNISSSIIGIIALQISVEWHPKFEYSLKSAKSLLALGGNIMGASLIGTVFNELKGLLIGRLYTPADLALFNKGGNFPKLISNNISGALGNVLFPAMSQFSDDRSKIKQLTRRSIRLSSYYVFFILTVLIVICRPLVVILYTEKWLGCVPYMQLVCLELMIGILSSANLQALKAAGEGGIIIKLEVYKKPVFLIMTIIGANISVMALAITLPLYAVYSTLVNLTPNVRVLDYSYSEQFSDLAPATFLSIAMVPLSYPLHYLIHQNFLLIVAQVVTCFIVYILGSYLFKVDSYQYTMDIMKAFLKKII